MENPSVASAIGNQLWRCKEGHSTISRQSVVRGRPKRRCICAGGVIAFEKTYTAQFGMGGWGTNQRLAGRLSLHGVSSDISMPPYLAFQL